MTSGYRDNPEEVALNKLRTAIGKAIDAQKITEREYAHTIQQLKIWEAQYEQSVHENDLSLFSQAVFQCERYQAIAARIEPLLKQHKNEIVKLQDQLISWKNRMQ